MYEKINSVIDFLDRQGIRNKVFRCGDEFGAYINPKGDSNPEWAMMQCYAQICHAMKKGKIYKPCDGKKEHICLTPHHSPGK